jgi:hypothetical protein
MEEILRKLQKEASGSKYKAIKESCTWALGERARASGEGTRAGPAGRAGLSPSVGDACMSVNRCGIGESWLGRRHPAACPLLAVSSPKPLMFKGTAVLPAGRPCSRSPAP